MPPLIKLLDHGEFDIRKEAVWAISNATSGGTPDQIRFMVSRHVIPPLCRLLMVPDPKVLPLLYANLPRSRVCMCVFVLVPATSRGSVVWC